LCRRTLILLGKQPACYNRTRALVRNAAKLVMSLRSAKQGVMNLLLQQNNAIAFIARKITTFLKRNLLGRLI
jgi:hypothetical protein